MSTPIPIELQIIHKMVDIMQLILKREENTSEDLENVISVVNNFLGPTSQQVTLVRSTEGMNMGDTYITGQAGIVASSARDISFTQMWNQASASIDLAALSLDLDRVRDEMERAAEGEPERYAALAEVARAKQAADKADGSSVMQHLQKAGSWALDVAKVVGAGVAVAAIKSALGMA